MDDSKRPVRFPCNNVGERTYEIRQKSFNKSASDHDLKVPTAVCVHEQQVGQPRSLMKLALAVGVDSALYISNHSFSGSLRRDLGGT